MIRTGAVLLTLMTLWHVLLSGPDPNGAERHREVVQNLLSLRSHGSVRLAGGVYSLPVPDSVVASHLNGDIHDVDEATAQALAFGQGPVRLAIRARLVLFARFIALFTPLFLLWRTLGLFLIAAGLVKLGFLDTAARARWKRTAIVGFTAGIPMTIAGSSIKVMAYEAPGGLAFVGSALHDVSALLLAAAISSLVLVVCSPGRLRFLGRGLESVGRLALTNYILQSVIMTLFATSIGLGLFARVSRLEILSLCLPVLGFQMIASLLWTHNFRMGPLEWIWRAATYRALPPNRIRRPAITS